MPPHKCFHRRIVRQSEVSIQARSGGIARFGTLPEFPGVTALERHHVFLGLMDENAKAFLNHLIRAHWNGHFNLFYVPFLPCALVQPEPATIDPFITISLDASQGFKYHIKTNKVCSMRISEITGTINLLRFYFAEQPDRDLKILFSHRIFLVRSCFVKRKINEMYIFIRDSNITAGWYCLAAADQPFDTTDRCRINLV